MVKYLFVCSCGHTETSVVMLSRHTHDLHGRPSTAAERQPHIKPAPWKDNEGRPARVAGRQVGAQVGGGIMRPHRHRWKVSMAFGVPHARCVRCAKVTLRLRPWSVVES